MFRLRLIEVLVEIHSFSFSFQFSDLLNDKKFQDYQQSSASKGTSKKYITRLGGKGVDQNSDKV